MTSRYTAAIVASLLPVACAQEAFEMGGATGGPTPAGVAGYGPTGVGGAVAGTQPGVDEFCWEDGTCSAGRVCDATSGCAPIVPNCPSTPECLADPPGYEPPPLWTGLDPAYAGSFGTDPEAFRTTVHLEFYEDHLYGEGLVLDLAQGLTYEVVLTGIRSGTSLQGQIVPVWADRTFDATFTAELLSGSEIAGTFVWASDLGQVEGPFRWLRTSPCGCTQTICTCDEDCTPETQCVDAQCQPRPTCVRDDECQASEVCEAGRCQPVPCTRDSECLLDEICEGGVCVPAPPCVNDADCGTGAICKAGQCLTGVTCADDTACGPGEICEAGDCVPTQCLSTCDCASGEECTAGRCVPRDSAEQPCDDDCDCDYQGGERCVAGLCEYSG